jgi:hypothetical protein
VKCSKREDLSVAFPQLSTKGFPQDPLLSKMDGNRKESTEQPLFYVPALFADHMA